MILGKLTKIGTLFLLGAVLVSGCSTAAKKTEASSSPDPSSSPTESESEKPIVIPKIDYNDKIVLANNALELEFLTIALASCEKAQKDGFSVTSGDRVSYFRPAEEGIFPYWPFDEVTVKNGVAGPAAYQNYFPGLLSPCDLELEARLWSDQIDAVALEHKVVLNSDGTYSWFEHYGGYSLEETRFKVQDGLVVEYAEKTKVGYGPFTAAQKALFDQLNQ